MQSDRMSEPVRLNCTLRLRGTVFGSRGRSRAWQNFPLRRRLAGKNSFVILSHHLWQQRFASDPSVIGHWINLEGVQRQIVGVMPAEFRFPSPKSDLWIPLNIDSRDATAIGPAISCRCRPLALRRHHEQAAAEMHLFQSQLPAYFRGPCRKPGTRVVSVVSLQSGLSAMCARAC